MFINYKYYNYSMNKIKIISKIRVNKINGQKVITIPKQKETEDWEGGDYVEINKVKIK